MGLSTVLERFISAEKLPESYIHLAKQWFLPVLEEIIEIRKTTNKQIVIGVNGTQGSGKSTISALFTYVLKELHQLNAYSLSIDDFYLTKAERQQLATTVHPLLITRGVPGTHDISLAEHILDEMAAGKPVAIPRFNKAQDDRFGTEDFTHVTDTADVIILEGWCVGSTAQLPQALTKPSNILEAEEDADAKWRSYANTCLEQQYQSLFERIDIMIMLKAPSFECVYQWRLQQEQKLLASLKEGDDQSGIMSPTDILRFIQHYQRITEHILNSLPERCDYVFELDENRAIQSLHRKKTTQNSNIINGQQILIFTDLDGSLLNHHDYRVDSAIPLLKVLKNKAIPVISNTSKTAAEIKVLRRHIDNQEAFICENGAAAYLPKALFPVCPFGADDVDTYWRKPFVKTRAHWNTILDLAPEKYSPYYKSFSQLGTKGIIEATGLPEQNAVLANQREYSEPLLWLGDEDNKSEFIRYMEDQGVTLLQGGRFLHIGGKCDKASAMHWLSNLYEQQTGKKVSIIAIGDSGNDTAMLEQANYAVVVKRPEKSHLSIQQNNQYLTESEAPEGWVEGVEHTLQALNIAIK